MDGAGGAPFGHDPLSRAGTGIKKARDRRASSYWSIGSDRLNGGRYRD